MKTILYLNHQEVRCGVYQLGAATGEALQKSLVYRFVYVEVANSTHAYEAIDACQPAAIICNWHPSTMGWLCNNVVKKFSRPIGVTCHDVPYPHIAHAHLHLDPTFPECWERFRVRRLVPEFTPPLMDHGLEQPVIGSFGFGFGNKGFERLVQRVNAEFTAATVRLHIAGASFGDPNGTSARAVAERCLRMCKPGISLVASHEFMTRVELLNWLACNSINCFFYDVMYGRGVSSVIDLALAVQRPIAITQSWMFRHLMNAKQEISIECRDLKDILAGGDAPLIPYRNDWNAANVVSDYERVADFLTKQQ